LVSPGVARYQTEHAACWREADDSRSLSRLRNRWRVSRIAPPNHHAIALACRKRFLTRDPHSPAVSLK
jgi:hypothetical protein